MFKFPLYIALCVSLIYYNFVSASNPKLESLGIGEYCIYSTQSISSEYVTKQISTGIGYIYYCESTNAAALRSLFHTIDGESITLTNISAKSILKKLKYNKVSGSNDGVMETYYAFSNKGERYIKLDSTKINLQIAQRGNTVTVGWPVILGSY